MGTHPIFESDFDCLTEMIRFCHLRRSSLIPKDILKDRNMPVRYRKKEDPKKALRSEIQQTKKHERLFDEHGIMFKVVGTLVSTLLISSAAGFYRAWLFEDLDENLAQTDELAMKSATFKFATAHLGWAAFLVPGRNCLFPHLCLRSWGVNLLTQKSHLKTVTLFAQLVVCFICAMTSLLSLDASSVDWINSLSEEDARLARSLAIHPASQVSEHLYPHYKVLHDKTVMFKNYGKAHGVWDSKVASILFSDESKNRILTAIADHRQRIKQRLFL